MNSRLAGPLGPAQVTRILDKLESAGRVVRRTNVGYTLSEAARSECHDLLEQGKERRAIVTEEFTRTFDALPSDTRLSWETFRTDLLVPLVSELGAKTYHIPNR